MHAQRMHGCIFGVVWQTKHGWCYRISNDLLQSVTVNPPLVFRDASPRWDEMRTCTSRHGTVEMFV